MRKKTDLSLFSLRSITTWGVLFLFTLTSCMAPPVANQKAPLRSQGSDGGFRTQSTQVTEPPPPQLEQVPNAPDNPAYELRFQSGQPVANTVRMPDQGSLSLVMRK